MTTGRLMFAVFLGIIFFGFALVISQSPSSNYRLQYQESIAEAGEQDRFIVIHSESTGNLTRTIFEDTWTHQMYLQSVIEYETYSWNSRHSIEYSISVCPLNMTVRSE